MTTLVLLAPAGPAASLADINQGLANSGAALVYAALPAATPIDTARSTPTTRSAPTTTRNTPIDITTADLNAYCGLIVPDGGGFGRSSLLTRVLDHFVSFRLPVCLIAHGTSCLLETEPLLGSGWLLAGYSLTSVRLLTQPSNLSNALAYAYDPSKSTEDFIRSHYGIYAANHNTRPHVVIGSLG